MEFLDLLKNAIASIRPNRSSVNVNVFAGSLTTNNRYTSTGGAAFVNADVLQSASAISINTKGINDCVVIVNDNGSEAFPFPLIQDTITTINGISSTADVKIKSASNVFVLVHQ